MIAAALLLALHLPHAPAPHAPAPHAPPPHVPPPHVPGADVVARLRAEPAQVEVGEPVAWVLEVEHGVAVQVRLPEGDPIPDDSWVLLEPRAIVRGVASGTGAGATTHTRAVWRVMSLEPGERALPAIGISVEENGEARKVDVAAGVLSVRPALAEGEDAPRPIRGFRDPPGEKNRALVPWMAALVIVGSLLALFVWRRRARRKPAPAPAPTALERLGELERSVTEGPARARWIVYELCRLLRESTDTLVGADRAALVDLEWAALVEADERVPLGSRRSIARILRDAEQVKYARHEPTRFALQETLAGARSALEALAEASAQTSTAGAASARTREVAA